MNILNSYLLTSISGSSSGSEPKSNGILITNIFLTTLVTSIFTPELHSLLVSAISWCTVAVILFMVRKQAARNGELQVTIDRKTRRKVTALVWCILLSGICERVVGPAWTGKAAWWNKVCNLYPICMSVGEVVVNTNKIFGIHSFVIGRSTTSNEISAKLYAR